MPYTVAMYELTVTREFCAAHAIVIKGQREPVHGHNWRVTAAVGGGQLDDDGLLCDFHHIERDLDDILRPLHNNDLNAIEPFTQLNPTAEHVAQHIADRLQATLPAGVKLLHVTVTEAPGCAATYRPA